MSSALLLVRDGVVNPVTVSPPYITCSAILRRAAATLRRWRQEVLNYWRYPLINAPVEGKHNRIKALKRRGYRSRNNRSFLPRILNLVHTD
jgi:transposase